MKLMPRAEGGATIRLAALAAAALLPAEARADNPLTGTWVADLSSQQGLPRDVYSVRDGTYSCDSCVPRRHYPADGRMRPVAGNPQELEAVTIVDARTILTQIVQPGLVRTTRMQVSRDGRRATYVSMDRRAGIKGPLRTEYVARRAGPGPAGSHAVSGTWQGVRYVSVPLQLRTTLLTDDGEKLSYRTGTGYSYLASYTGSFVPIAGPYDGGISVSVRKPDAYRVIETRRQGGRDIQLRSYVVSRDGRRLEIETTNLATNGTFRISATKRSRKGGTVTGPRGRLPALLPARFRGRPT
jgi:hypothetical protein